MKVLTVSDLEERLSVKSLFSRKKLLKWIQGGFEGFEKFVENKKKTKQMAPC